MSQDLTQSESNATPEAQKPLNARQKAFGRELGVALAAGDRDFTEAYGRAGFARHRGNAARLAADPRVRAIADEICESALRLAGVHAGFLQSQAMKLLDTSPTSVLRIIGKFVEPEIIDVEGQKVVGHYRLRDNLTAAEIAELDAAAWPVSKLKIDKDGVIAIDLPDKKGLVEMLGKWRGLGKDETNTNVNVGVGVVGSVRFVVEHAPVANAPVPAE